MTGPSLETIVTITYTDTSRHLLDVLNRTYSFGEHLMVIILASVIHSVKLAKIGVGMYIINS